MTSVLDPRDRDGILEYVRPIWTDSWRAFEAGTEHAVAYFRDQPVEAAQTRDPWLFAHLARFQAKTFLSTRGHDAHIDPMWLANSGVAVRYGQVDIRYLKADRGNGDKNGLPAPGWSRRKRAFYRQEIQNPLFMFDQPRELATVNLVVTWDYDSSGVLFELTCHSPRAGHNTRESVASYWHASIPHPATAVQVPAEATDEYADDLEIAFPEASKPVERHEAG
jgi:hypothetical protein